MKFIYILLILIVLSIVLFIIYLNGNSKLSVIQLKMDNANDNITRLLKQKYDLMNKLYTQIKKVIEKKDYLKGFSTLKKQKLSNYDLDKELYSFLETMIHYQEDYKKLKNKDFKDTLKQIELLEQQLTANKKFFNKNNDLLIKELKGYTKIVGQISKIHVQTSYEIKAIEK